MFWGLLILFVMVILICKLLEYVYANSVIRKGQNDYFKIANSNNQKAIRTAIEDDCFIWPSSFQVFEYCYGDGSWKYDYTTHTILKRGERMNMRLYNTILERYKKTPDEIWNEFKRDFGDSGVP